MSLAVGLFSALAVSPAGAQTVRSYCLTGIDQELGHCDYATFEACRLAGAGYGSCIASEQPVSGSLSAATAAPAAKRRK
jgi:hypothetical protein